MSEGGGPSLNVATLFYELEARSTKLSQGFEEGIQAADKFTKFMLEHPIAVTAAVTAAFAAFAIHLGEEAAKVNLIITQLGQLIPDFGDQAERVRSEINDLAASTGQSFEKLLAASQAIASQGTTGVDDLIGRLKVINEVSQVTGVSMETLAEQFGRVAREFDISGTAITDMGAKLFSLAKGRAPIDEITGALTFAAPSIRALGLDFDTASAAIASLIDEGLKARQAGAIFKQLAADGQDGANIIRSFAAQANLATNANEELADSFEKVQEQVETQQKRAFENFEASLRNLGQTLLPAVTLGVKALTIAMDGLAAIIDLFNTKIPKLEVDFSNLPTSAAGLKNVMANTSTEIEKLQDQLELLEADKFKDESQPRGGDPGDRAVQRQQAAERDAEILKTKALIESLNGALKEVQSRLNTLGKDLPTGNKQIDSFVDIGKRLAGTGKKVQQQELLGINPDDVQAAIAANALLAKRTDEIGAAAKAATPVLVNLFHEVKQASAANAQTAAQAAQQLESVQENIANLLGNVANQATQTVAGITNSFAGQTEALNKQLDQAYDQLIKLTEKAAKDAKKVGGGAFAEVTADNAAALSKFKGLADTIKQAFQATHDKAVALADAKELTAQQNALEESSLRAAGEIYAADQLALDNKEALYESSIRQQVAEDKLSGTAGERAIALAREADANNRLAQQRQTQQALEARFASEESDINVTHLRQIGQIRDAEKASADAKYQAELRQIGLDNKAGAFGSEDTPEAREAHDAALLEAIQNAITRHKQAIHAIDLESIDDSRKITAEYFNMANAAVDVLAATGAIPANLQAALKSALGLGQAIVTAVDAIHDLNDGSGTLLGSLSSITGVISAVGAVVGAISSLFGDSPEEKAAKQKQYDANATVITALDRLTDALNSATDVTISGKSFSVLSSSLPAIENDIGRRTIDAFRKNFFNPDLQGATADAFRAAGTSIADFVAEAKTLGITLTSDTLPSMQDIENVSKAIRREQFTAIAQSFGGQLSELTERFKVLGQTGTAQFGPLVDLLTSDKFGAPAIFHALQGIDVSTVQGAAKASEIVKQIFLDFESGKIDPSAFGGLDPQQFFDAINSLLGIIPGTSDATVTLAQDLTSLQRRFTVFGTSLQVQVGQTLAAIIAHGSDAVKQTLSGIDVSTLAGRNKLRDAIQNLFTEATQGIEGNLDLGGITPDDLANFISTLNQDFPDTVDSVKALSDALGTLQASFTIFGTTAVDQVNQTIQALVAHGSADTAKAFAGADASTKAGRQAIITAIQTVFTHLKDGADEGAISIGDLTSLLGLLTSNFNDTTDAAKQLSDALSSVTQDAQAYGNNTAVSKLVYTLKNIGDAGKSIVDAVSGFDLTTVAGLQGADAALQSLYRTAKQNGLTDLATDILNFITMIRDGEKEIIDAAQAQQDAQDKADQQNAQDAATELSKEQQAAKDAATAAAAAQQAIYQTGTDGITRLQNQLGLFDITDPVQKLQSLVGVLKAGAPVFQQVLGNIDVTTAGGRVDALNALQQFFLANPYGTASGLFDAGTVLAQTLAAAQSVKDAQKAVDGSVSGTSQSFGINQTITEVTGDRMAGLIGTTNVILGEIRDDIRSALSLGSQIPNVPLIPPTITSASGTAGGVSFFQFYFGNTELSTSGFSADTLAAAKTVSQLMARDIALKTVGG